MSLGIEWLNDVLRWLIGWLPSCELMEITHEGVKVSTRLFRGGVKVSKLQPGLYWYHPRLTKVYSTAVVRQPVDLPCQSVDTSDGKPIMFSVSLVYRVSDVEKWLTKTEDPDKVIKEIGAAAATDCVATRTWSDLRKEFASGKVEEEVLSETKAALRKYGVSVEDARFTDCVKHQALRTEGQSNVISLEKDND